MSQQHTPKHTYIKSIFEQISAEVFRMTNLDEAKYFITKFITDKHINEQDKLNITKAVSETRSIVAFQRYICNALLKYEGLGVSQLSKETNI
jgi:hypothetical protein